MLKRNPAHASKYLLEGLTAAKSQIVWVEMKGLIIIRPHCEGNYIKFCGRHLDQQWAGAALHGPHRGEEWERSIWKDTGG